MTFGGGKPHTNVGDRGQRFEVRWRHVEATHEKAERVFGWSDDLDGAQKMAKAWELAPYVAKAWVVDRQDMRERPLRDRITVHND